MDETTRIFTSLRGKFAPKDLVIQFYGYCVYIPPLKCFKQLSSERLTNAPRTNMISCGHRLVLNRPSSSYEVKRFALSI